MTAEAIINASKQTANGNTSLATRMAMHAAAMASSREAQAFKWNLSGSTFIHILLILGLGFYISLPTPQTPKHTIVVNLSQRAALSNETKAGAGDASAKTAQAANKEQPRQNRIVHTSNTNASLSSDFILQQQSQLLEAIKQQDKMIKEAERIGFLSPFNVNPAYQQYQEYWQQHVSEFGTAHYPRGLIEKRLSGKLDVGIAIDKNGRVRSVDIYQSSGITEVDDAALKIAIQASPYAPLPDEIADDVDILHIIRTWDFNNATFIDKAKQ